MSSGSPNCSGFTKMLDRDHVALGPGPGHQRDMPGVQRPHGGDEPHRAAGGPGLRPGPRGSTAAVSTTCIAYTAAGTVGTGGTVGSVDSASCVARAAPAW